LKQTVSQVKRVRGTVTPPGDKSISHRAAIFNAIAQGVATVEGFQQGADCLSTLRCLRALGVRLELDGGGTLRIEGAGRHGLREPLVVLNCGNSGTTMRLLTGLLAAQPFFSVMTGDSSLRSRPMARVIEPLARMGATIAARESGTKAPLAIHGGVLSGISYEMPVASAQVKSALLLAGLYAKGETSVTEPAPTRDHTERMLKAMGAQIQFGEGPRVMVRPLDRELNSLSLRVPGDISAAAPWLVLGAIHPDAELRIPAVCVNPTRTGILDILHAMGADLRLEEERTWGGEPVADIVVRSSQLHGTEVGGDLVPRAVDELPVVALAASLAEGATVVRDAVELRAKESDRIKSTASELRRLGADVSERPDGFEIRGVKALKGAAVSSHADHRLAMMLAVAGAVAEGETDIRTAEAVAVSYPLFWQEYEQVTQR
jgi:3-phosphoshikimate 1-carboxyvinyltransferase